VDSDAETTAKRIGRTVSAWLAASELSIMALHKRTGIARNTLYQICAGNRMPSIDVLERIASELKTSAGVLLDGTLPSSSTGEESAVTPLAVAAEMGSPSTDPTTDEAIATLFENQQLILSLFARHVPGAESDPLLRRIREQGPGAA